MKLNIKEMAVFAMLGSMMFASKLLMDAFPNMHLLGVQIVAYTAVFRQKALYPIYVYVLLLGLVYGFSTWWIPNLYIWTVLWGAVMLLPRTMSVKVAAVVYIAVCGAHGFLYGILYAPMQALLFGLSFEGMIAWIVAGFPFDIIHGVSNCLVGLLIMPLIRGLNTAKKYT